MSTKQPTIRPDLSVALKPSHGLTDPDGGSVRAGGGTYGPNDAERWLADYDAEHVPPVTVSHSDSTPTPYRGIGPRQDVLSLSGNASTDNLTYDLTDFGAGDPQRAYDTGSGHIMADAVRVALRTSLDLRDLQESIRQAHNGLRFGTSTDKGFSGNAATFKAGRKAVLKAYASLTSEAGEALLPYGASADRWAASASPDPMTYGSPVVTQALNLTYAVNGQGTVYPPLTVVMATTVAMHAQTRKDGVYRPDVIALPWMSPVEAITRTDGWSIAADKHDDGPSWVADQWTGYRPDVNTVSADRFAAKRRPTDDESADPLPPVRKPSSRKRKRDGAMGGPAILSHR